MSPSTKDMLLNQVGIFDINSILFQLDFYFRTHKVSEGDKTIILTALGLSDYILNDVILAVLDNYQENFLLNENFLKQMLQYYESKGYIQTSEYDIYIGML